MNLAAAGLAHETRNPLNIIRGLAQMISKQPGTHLMGFADSAGLRYSGGRVVPELLPYATEV